MTTTPLDTGRMALEHVEALLALLVSLDGRLRAPDAATAEIRAKAWTSLLGEVDPAFAVRYVEHAYQELRDVAMTPAEILVAWREDQRVQAETAGAAKFDADRYLDTGARAGWDPVMIDYLRDVLEAHQRGEDVGTVPRPQTTRQPLTPAQDAWQRRCAFHRICACDHTRCRAGFLDEVTHEPGGFDGSPYEKVTRCPFCADALAMAVEQGIAKNPQARGAGQRRRS